MLYNDCSLGVRSDSWFAVCASSCLEVATRYVLIYCRGKGPPGAVVSRQELHIITSEMGFFFILTGRIFVFTYVDGSRVNM